LVNRVESGEMVFHRGVDIVFDPLNNSQEKTRAFGLAAMNRNKLVTQVVFLQNLPRVGDYACFYAANLVVIDIPEGVESIGRSAFGCCSSLTKVSFPMTIISISQHAFCGCSSLENIDLLHTNLQELGRCAFGSCSELKSMTIPDSLQALGQFVFDWCSKLVPSNIDVNSMTDDATSEVVAHIRSKQQ